MNMQLRMFTCGVVTLLAASLHGMNNNGSGNQQDDEQQVPVTIEPAWFHPDAPMARNGSGTQPPFTSPVSAISSPAESILSNGIRAPHATPQFAAIQLQADIPFSDDAKGASVENDEKDSFEQILNQINDEDPYRAKLLRFESELLGNASTVQAYMHASAEDKAAIIHAIERCFPFLVEQAPKDPAVQEQTAHEQASQQQAKSFVGQDDVKIADSTATTASTGATSTVPVATGIATGDDVKEVMVTAAPIDAAFDLSEIDQVRNDDNDDDDDDGKDARVCMITPRPGSTTSNPNPSPSIESVFAFK